MTLPLAALLGAREIIGTAGLNKGLDSLLTTPLPKRHQHEIERRLEIVSAVGAKADAFEMEFTPASSTRPIFQKNGKPLVILHPGAKDRFKQWPPRQFIAVGKRLQEEKGCEIVVTGSPSERLLVDAVASALSGAHALTDLSLDELASLLKGADLMICNDTGPMHLAFAMKTPTLALFTPTDPTLCGPYFVPGNLIQKRPTCRPCVYKKCQDPFCLLQIGVEEVYDAAINLLPRLCNFLDPKASRYLFSGDLFKAGRG